MLRSSLVTWRETAFSMDAVDIAGFLEFDSIVLRDGLLESSEAVQQIVAEKWAFTKEPVGKSRPSHGEEASGVGIRVEGEVVYLDVEEDDDQDVDVEGDEAASVTRPPANIRSEGVGSVDCDIKGAEVPGVTEPKKLKTVYSLGHSEGVAECDSSLPRAASAPPTCSLCLRHFSSEIDRARHICFVTSGVDGSPRSFSYRGEAISGTPSSSGSDVRQRRCEPPMCEIRSDETGGMPRPEDSEFAIAIRDGGVAPVCGDSRTAAIPTLLEAGASVLPKTAGDARAFLWKSALGMCGICGKVFNNNSNLKRHAHLHGHGILLTCDVCGEFFPDRRALWRHKERHSGKSQSKTYKCSICGKCVNSPHSLRRHRAQHVQPYVCDVCGESFHRASGLQIHKYLHVR